MQTQTSKELGPVVIARVGRAVDHIAPGAVTVCLHLTLNHVSLVEVPFSLLVGAETVILVGAEAVIVDLVPLETGICRRCTGEGLIWFGQIQSRT